MPPREAARSSAQTACVSYPSRNLCRNLCSTSLLLDRIRSEALLISRGLLSWRSVACVALVRHVAHEMILFAVTH